MIASGSTLLHYRVLDQIGEGGMGAVWRATDTTLGRDVAIKVLPAGFLQDPERLARFEREAKLLASLSHPNVATVHGFHRVDGETFLVMELLPGEDLAERIARGALPFDEALPIALQVAEALEAAHERGIVHRDLKPANVQLLPSGQVKVLDFGLAKAVLGEISGPGSSPSRTPTILPTMTSAGAPTAMGVILGTAAYMSPEQAKGKPVDRRADLWAFGCLVFEMLAGRRPFDGETVSEAIASVLKEQPDWSALPAATSGSVRRVLQRCLEKDPARRMRSAADAALDLQARDEPGVEKAQASPPSRAAWVPWALAGALTLALGAVLLRPGPAPTRSRSVDLGLPEGHTLSDLAAPVISPDGTMVVMASSSGSGQSRLSLRALDAFEPVELPGTDGAKYPFWSPDSRHIGYFVPGELRRLDVASRTSQLVCACAPWGRGAAWTTDGTILFSPDSNAPILSVSASGGEPVQITTLDPSISDISHRFPVILPDGDQFLFTLWSNSPEALAQHGGIYVASRKGGAPRRLLTDASAVVLAPHALLLQRGGQLVAIPFDAVALTVKPEATTIAPSVRFSPSVGDLYASASTAGDLLFAGGPSTKTAALDLVWLDRKGAATPALDRTLDASELALSPDGTRFVATVAPKQTGFDDLWLGEFARGTVVRLTSGGNDSFAPHWSPDGRFVAFSNRDTGNEDIYRIRVDGTGVPERIFDAKDIDTHVTDWSADGRLVFFNGANKRTQHGKTQVWTLDLQTHDAKVLLESARAAFGFATLSPDGRWLAYVSDESGQNEVYVRSFPALDRKWQISRQGGEGPHWRKDGREIVFLAANVQVLAAAVAPEKDELHPGTPELLFTAPRALRAIAIAPDDARVLTAVPPVGSTEPPLRLILGWR